MAVDAASPLPRHDLELGEAPPAEQEGDATPFAPRRTEDLIEEQFFEHGRDLFSWLDLKLVHTSGLCFKAWASTAPVNTTTARITSLISGR